MIGWFKASRHPDATLLLKENHHAFVLAYVIAQRARWNASGFNPDGLQIGDALLGDWSEYSMTKQEYRTAKIILKKHGFATLTPTPKGTIARLTDSRLFECLSESDNTQPSTPTTLQSTPGAAHEQHPEQPLTKNKDQKSKEQRGLPVLSSTDKITHSKELERVEARIEAIRQQYSGMQTWTLEDRVETKKLKERRTILRKILGVVI